MLYGRRRAELEATESPRNLALHLHCIGQPLVSVRGPVTGKAYQFSSLRPVHPVDLRDAKYLLASPLFRLSR